MHRSHLKWALASVILLAGSQLARAEVIIDIDQIGSNVVSTASGTIDLTDLTFQASGSEGSFILPAVAWVIDGSASTADVYRGINSGPSHFGTGPIATAPTSSGDIIGVSSKGLIYVPAGYVSGTSLSATDTYDGQTFTSMGLTPGTYIYTWGTGIHADSLTVNIGVPLPSAFAGGSAGLLLLAGWAWRQRRSAAAMA